MGRRGRSGSGIHWYYPDGVEYQWQPAVATPVPGELEPGKSAKVSVNVRVPDRDGAYILSFDVVRMPDTYLATQPVTYTGDLGLVPVRVDRGTTRFRRPCDRSLTWMPWRVRITPPMGTLTAQEPACLPSSSRPDVYGIAAYFSTGKDGKPLKDAPPYPSGYFADTSPSRPACLLPLRPENARREERGRLSGAEGDASRRSICHPASGGGGDGWRGRSHNPLSCATRTETEKKIAISVGDWKPDTGRGRPHRRSRLPQACARRRLPRLRRHTAYYRPPGHLQRSRFPDPSAGAEGKGIRDHAGEVSVRRQALGIGRWLPAPGLFAEYTNRNAQSPNA